MILTVILLLFSSSSPFAMSTEPPVANFVDGTFRNVGETCPIYFDVGAPIRFKAIVGEKSFEYTEAYFGVYNTSAPLKIWKRGINPDAESSSDDDYCSNQKITRTTCANTVFTIPPTYKAGKYTLSLRGGHVFLGSSREGDKAVLHFFVGKPDEVPNCSKAFGARIPEPNEPYAPTAYITIENEQNEIFHVGDRIDFSVRPLDGDLDAGFVRVVKVGTPVEAGLDSSYTLHDGNGEFPATRDIDSRGALEINAKIIVPSADLLYRNEGEPDFELFSHIREDLSRIDSYLNLRESEREILREWFMTKYENDKKNYAASDALTAAGQAIGVAFETTKAVTGFVPTLLWNTGKATAKQVTGNRYVQKKVAEGIGGETMGTIVDKGYDVVDTVIGKKPDTRDTMTKIKDGVVDAGKETVKNTVNNLQDQLTKGANNGAAAADCLAETLGLDEQKRLQERLVHESIFQLWCIRNTDGKEYLLGKSMPFFLRQREAKPFVEEEKMVEESQTPSPENTLSAVQECEEVETRE